MSTIIIGNVSEIKSVPTLAAAMQGMANEVCLSIVDSKNSYSRGIVSHFKAVELAILKARTAVIGSTVKIQNEFLVTFRQKVKEGGETIFTVSTNSALLEKEKFPIVKYLKQLNIPAINGVDIVVSMDNLDFDDLFKDIKNSVTVLKGCEVFVRAKYIIKPAQPGKEILTDWVPLSDDISIVVTAVEATELAHLQSVVAENDYLSIDDKGNISINI